jgi:hypothetical protein
MKQKAGVEISMFLVLLMTFTEGAAVMVLEPIYDYQFQRLC